MDETLRELDKALTEGNLDDRSALFDEGDESPPKNIAPSAFDLAGKLESHATTDIKRKELSTKAYPILKKHLLSKNEATREERLFSSRYC